MNCLKHVEFHDKINLWNWCVKLVLLQRNLLQCKVTWHKKKMQCFGRPPSLENTHKCKQNWNKEKTCRPYSRNWYDTMWSACTHSYAFSPWSWRRDKNIGFLKNILCAVQNETELCTQNIHHYGLDTVCCHPTA